MSTYTINFIIDLCNNISNNKLNNDVEIFLNNILLDIKKPVFNITPNFNNNNSYNKNKNKNQKNFKNTKRNSFKEDTFIEKNLPDKLKLNKTYDSNSNSNSNYNSNSNSNYNSNFNSKSDSNSNFNSKSDSNSNSNTDSNSNYDSNSYSNNYRINRIKDINNKSEYELVLLNIKKILNKLSSQNYNKLKNEFICYYKSIYDDKIHTDLNKINIFIFETLIYNNTIFNDLYCDLLYNLININSDFSILLNNYLEILINIYKYIKTPSSISYNELSETNKHNDKYVCLCGFYISCYKLNLIPLEIISELIVNIIEELFINIKIDNKKEYNEILMQFIFFIVSKISYNIINNEIKDNILYISKLTNKSYPSITNKIIFKCKDIIEEKF